MTVSQAWIDANGAITAALVSATLGVDVSTVGLTAPPPARRRRLSDTQLLLTLQPSAAGVGLPSQAAEVALSAADWLLDMDTAIVPGPSMPCSPAPAATRTRPPPNVGVCAAAWYGARSALPPRSRAQGTAVKPAPVPADFSVQSAATSSASSGRRASPPAAAPAGSAGWTAPCP